MLDPQVAALETEASRARRAKADADYAAEWRRQLLAGELEDTPYQGIPGEDR